MHKYIDLRGHCSEIDPSTVVLDNYSCDILGLLALHTPPNTLIVEEGVIAENTRDSDQQWIDLINQQDVERVVFANSNGRADKLLANCKQYDIKHPYYVLSACANYRQHPEIVFFPEEELVANQQTPLPLSKRTHKFSSLNSNPWSHRILTYLHLVKKPYFSDMIFSWGRVTGWTKDFLFEEDFINDIVITDEEWAELKTLPERILAHPEDDTTHNDRSADHVAYTRACLNIITETTSRNDTPQLTEKSFKPILAGQFFVMIGSRGLVQYMRDIGFDVFDDIVNHSYDNIEDDRERIAAVMKELDSLHEVDLFKLHKECTIRFKKNQDWLTSTDFKRQFDADISIP